MDDAWCCDEVAVAENQARWAHLLKKLRYDLSYVYSALTRSFRFYCPLKRQIEPWRLWMPCSRCSRARVPCGFTWNRRNILFMSQGSRTKMDPTLIHFHLSPMIFGCVTHSIGVGKLSTNSPISESFRNPVRVKSN